MRPSWKKKKQPKKTWINIMMMGRRKRQKKKIFQIICHRAVTDGNFCPSSRKRKWWPEMGAAVTGQEKKQKNKNRSWTKNVFFLHWSVVKTLITSIKSETEPAGIHFWTAEIFPVTAPTRERASQRPERNILTFPLNVARPQPQAYLNKSCGASHPEISAGVAGVMLLN